MNDDDYEDYEEDFLNTYGRPELPLEFVEPLARMLIARHRDEYEKMLAQHHIDALKQENSNLRREVADLKTMNPDGVNVTALSETVNRLATENERLSQVLEDHELKAALAEIAEKP